jgi:signal recognition particle subunit SEC65
MRIQSKRGGRRLEKSCAEKGSCHEITRAVTRIEMISCEQLQRAESRWLDLKSDVAR